MDTLSTVAGAASSLLVKTTVRPSGVMTASPLAPPVVIGFGVPPAAGRVQSRFVPLSSAAKTRVLLSGVHAKSSTKESKPSVRLCDWPEARSNSMSCQRSASKPARLCAR